jgi:hypothetical protein
MARFCRPVFPWRVTRGDADGDGGTGRAGSGLGNPAKTVRLSRGMKPKRSSIRVMPSQIGVITT